MPGKLIFTFVSFASRFDENSAATVGMQRLHQAVHKHGVPITWIVSAGSAPFQQKIITEWHNAYGDEIALCIDNLFTENFSDLEAIKKQIRTEKAKLAKIFPWSKLNIAGAGHQSRLALKAFEELGFDGVWGFCWEQIKVDNITDRGCPWGFYYLDPDNRLAPSRKPGKLVGIEWTSRDLCKAHHSGNPCSYSSDPNDVVRAGLCAYDDIEYWKRFIDGKPEDHFAETHIPPVQFISEKKMPRSVELEFKIDSEKAMPFGTCFRGDYRPYFLGEGAGILDYKIIQKELIFFRFDLKPGENFFRVKLSRK